MTMNNYNPLLLLDFYKVTHSAQYPQGLTTMVSYYTPRMSRLKDTDHVTLFGLQAFIQEYLIDGFNHNFFNRNEDEVVREYENVLTVTLGPGTYSADRIRALHRLGYLPLRIRAVPEGTRTKIGVPQIEIANTHPNFVWLVNTIETMLSCTMWHTQIAAEAGYRYYQITKHYAAITGGDPRRMIGDFSMRGQQSVESAIKASAAWLLSHRNTATVPAIMWLNQMYPSDLEDCGHGAISTEHSVMCSNFAVDGDEVTHIKRLLTEIYPNNSFSMVSDSYDYWNLVTNILPQCKEEILNHNGCLSIRGDSGDPVEVVAGVDITHITDEEDQMYLFKEQEYTWEWLQDEVCFFPETTDSVRRYYSVNDKLYSVLFEPIWGEEQGGYTTSDYSFIDHWNFAWTEIEPTAEIMGTVWALDQIFGHTINEKGYKVLNPHVKAIYGDSITPQRAKEIYRRLVTQGYSVENVSLGAGSFSFMCLETVNDGVATYSPFTRDTFGIAVKATYCEDAEGRAIPIFKQPKALSWKKSQKGCCVVASDGESYTDEWTYTMSMNDKNNLLTTVFEDGNIVKMYSLIEVRHNMYPEEE